MAKWSSKVSKYYLEPWLCKEVVELCMWPLMLQKGFVSTMSGAQIHHGWWLTLVIISGSFLFKSTWCVMSLLPCAVHKGSFYAPNEKFSWLFHSLTHSLIHSFIHNQWERERHRKIFHPLVQKNLRSFMSNPGAWDLVPLCLSIVCFKRKLESKSEAELPFQTLPFSQAVHPYKSVHLKSCFLHPAHLMAQQCLEASVSGMCPWTALHVRSQFLESTPQILPSSPQDFATVDLSVCPHPHCCGSCSLNRPYVITTSSV